jgi:hypothetical protein
MLTQEIGNMQTTVLFFMTGGIYRIENSLNIKLRQRHERRNMDDNA